MILWKIHVLYPNMFLWKLRCRSSKNYGVVPVKITVSFQQNFMCTFFACSSYFSRTKRKSRVWNCLQLLSFPKFYWLANLLFHRHFVTPSLPCKIYIVMYYRNIPCHSWRVEAGIKWEWKRRREIAFRKPRLLLQYCSIPDDVISTSRPVPLRVHVRLVVYL